MLECSVRYWGVDCTHACVSHRRRRLARYPFCAKGDNPLACSFLPRKHTQPGTCLNPRSRCTGMLKLYLRQLPYCPRLVLRRKTVWSRHKPIYKYDLIRRPSDGRLGTSSLGGEAKKHDPALLRTIAARLSADLPSPSKSSSADAGESRASTTKRKRASGERASGKRASAKRAKRASSGSKEECASGSAEDEQPT